MNNLERGIERNVEYVPVETPMNMAISSEMFHAFRDAVKDTLDQSFLENGEPKFPKLHEQFNQVYQEATVPPEQLNIQAKILKDIINSSVFRTLLIINKMRTVSKGKVTNILSPQKSLS